MTTYYDWGFPMTSEVHPAPASNSAIARPASGSRRSVCRAQVSTSPRSGGEAKRKASLWGEKAPRGADKVPSGNLLHSYIK